MGLSIVEALRQVSSKIRTWVNDTKVEKEAGKGLSTNDYDNDSKQIVDNLLNDDGDIKPEILPRDVIDVFEYSIQVSGEDFLNQIIATDIGTTVWIAAAKSHTGDEYYRKFAINTDGTINGITLFEPEMEKIYVAINNTNIYRWTGFNLVEISRSISLGETSTTAYAGNKGKANFESITALQTRLPQAPTTQGTYKLQVEVQPDGSQTFSWIPD